MQQEKGFEISESITQILENAIIYKDVFANAKIVDIYRKNIRSHASWNYKYSQAYIME